jgi:hypothetical protein
VIRLGFGDVRGVAALSRLRVIGNLYDLSHQLVWSVSTALRCESSSTHRPISIPFQQGLSAASTQV